MKRFSYTTVIFWASGLFGGKLNLPEFDEMLNEMGGKGWELVTVTASAEAQGKTTSFICVFKREA